MQIDPHMLGQFPSVEGPTAFSSEDGRINGWSVALPRGLPATTPAISGGQIFLGGGFGSYEFYAFDADTGRLRWQYQTGDDGPTAAVVEDDCVVFNTESCELEVLTVTGKSMWKHWLGDPLMSMPAVGGGRVFMAYPDSQGDHNHYLACFELKTGRLIWKQKIAGEIITAPTLACGRVYLSTLGGTMYCLRQRDGHLVWQQNTHATSSPLVVDGQCYYSQREEQQENVAAATEQFEYCAARAATTGSAARQYRRTRRKADYLDHGKRAARSAQYKAQSTMDGTVGFGSHKGDSKMYQAMANLGKAHVSEIWSYQGSKPFVSAGRLYAAMGDTISCTGMESEQVYWKKAIYREDDACGELLDSQLTPPALAGGKVFVGTSRGDVLCLSEDTGEEIWRAKLGDPVVFQPAVAGGRVYAGTQSGRLYCLETGDPQDDGWMMWGATPAHNGIEASNGMKEADVPSAGPVTVGLS